MEQVKLLHKFFEDQALRDPSQLAIIDDNGSYKYSELQLKIDNLAQTIVANQKIIKGTRIGIVTDRSASSIVAILAVLKIGCTFVPINPNLPRQRIQYILDKADISTIISTKKCWQSIAINKKKINFILTDQIACMPIQEHLSSITIKSEDIAYCLFTSGSTGDPKGVLIKHAGIVQSIKNFTEAYHISRDSRVLQFANLSFDASLSEIFPAFAAGATLCIPPKEMILDIDKLSTYISKLQITAAILPPTIIQYLTEDSFMSLKTLVSAGEECSAGLANAMSRVVPHFINAYGPTEASVGATTYEVDRQITEMVPIGKALPGYELHVLDEKHHRLPSNHVGELYIGGKGIFAGYIADRQKTDEVLIKNPFGEGFLYKTGDLVKQDLNGQLYYIGRSDFRIKLHGIRISPEEIEREIIQLPKVYECAVVDGFVESNKEHRLACYYTASEDLDLAKTRERLLLSLPSYSIPQVFIRIPSLPLTQNGKIDRQLLRTKPVKIKTKYNNSESTQTLDSILARIWKDVLGLDSISPDDNFFELGGTSISAMRIISKINALTNSQADINLIFEQPVFKDFAVVLENKSLYLKKCEDKKMPPEQDLTDSERLFWIADHALKKPEAYTLTEVFEIKGPINLGKVQESIEFLIDRFPILRANFKLKADKIEKVIKEKATCPFRLYDFANLDLEEARKKAKLTQDQITNTALGLESDWLFTAYYLKLSDIEGLLIFHVHHIIMDAKAMEIVSKSFWDCYANHSDNKQLEDSNRKCLLTTDNAESFWQEYLSQVEDSLVSLPYNNPKEDITENDGKTIIHPLPLSLAMSGRDVAAILGITPFSLFRNIFSLLLHRISNQTNLMIGTAVSLRDGNNENQVGAFLNTLPIRSTLQLDENISEFLLKQNKEFYSCFKYRNLPFHLIIKQTNDDSAKDPQSLFNVMFDYIASTDIPKVTNLQINRQRTFPLTTLCDLTLTIEELNGGFNLLWEYNTNLFNNRTIQRIMDWYERIFSNSIKDLNQKASSVDFLSQKEKQVLEEFNLTNSTIPQSCFIQEFENNLEKYPHEIAAVCGEETIDYKTLNKKANILARKLLSKKIETNNTVGVLMHRSIDLIVSILAIWKVRAAYVPLEPDFPEVRIRQMCKRASLSCVIAEFEEDKSKFDNDVIFLLFGAVCHKKEGSTENLNIDGSIHDLAYVIFTSGSTGKPKGVMIEQLGMVNHCYEMIKYFELDKDTVMAQTASSCFDISVWQLITPLLIGGRIVVYSKELQLNLKDFLKFVDRDNISIAELVPSYLIALLEHINNNPTDASKFKKIKHMLTTGEAASNKLIESWHAIYPGVPLTNAYGPAEASDDTNLYTLTRKEAIPNTPVPVGKPLGNIKVYILDPFLNKCPIGIKGEIYISGIAVGKGYINDAEKTKSVFLADPFSDNKVRMYKTGDIGSWNSDGTINFYGRADFQVKIRGFRIELEEIENQIKGYSAISQAAVIVKNFESSKQLHGFITSQQKIEENSIRDFLETKLPSYMIPQRIIQLEAMPLNNSGKVDRNALAKIDTSSCNDKSNESLSKKEQILLDIWRKVLKDNDIALDDNFFDLGGDSISSIQIISRLFSKGYHLGLENFFTHPTIRQLEPFVIERKDCNDIPISTQPFSLTPIQKSFFEMSPNNPAWYNQCIIVKGKDWNKEKLKEALLITLKTHPAFSIRFIGNSSQHYVDSLDFSKYILEFQAEYQQEIILRMNRMLDIENGPVLVASIVDYGNHEFELFIVAHHLIVDAFSWSIFMEDLEDNYHGTVLGKNQAQKVSGTNLQQWTNYLEERSTETETLAMLPFWVNMLKANADLSILSFDKQPLSHSRKVTALNFDFETSKKITDFASASKTLKMEHLVLSIISKSLCNCLPLNKITFMLERHGRSQVPVGINISRTIGWFTVIHPFLVKNCLNNLIGQAYTIADDLREIKDDGISYGLLRHRVSDLKALKEPVIAINFLGEMSRASSNGYFSDYKLIQDQVVDPQSLLEYKLEINSYIMEGQLFFECIYDSQDIPALMIEQLIEEIKRNTRSICKEIENSQTNGELNIKLANLSNDRLAEIQNRLTGSITNG